MLEQKLRDLLSITYVLHRDVFFHDRGESRGLVIILRVRVGTSGQEIPTNLRIEASGRRDQRRFSEHA